jgi:hypothetical protein
MDWVYFIELSFACQGVKASLHSIFDFAGEVARNTDYIKTSNS